MNIEEMVIRKKHFSLIWLLSLLGSTIAGVTYVYSSDISFLKTNRVATDACLLIGGILFLLFTTSLQKESRLGKMIAKQSKVLDRLKRNNQSLLKDLYRFEHDGYPVLDVLKEHPNRDFIGPYKLYVKERYHEAQMVFDGRGYVMDGECAQRFTNDLLKIEALPTGELVMLELRMSFDEGPKTVLMTPPTIAQPAFPHDAEGRN